MDKKQKLEELKNKQLELARSIMALDNELRKSENYEKYNTYVQDETNDVILETMFPTEYELAKELAEARGKLEPFYNEVLKTARAYYNQLNEKIVNLENKLKVNEEYIAKLDAEIKQQEENINAMKATEEYKSGDESTLLEVEKLQNLLKANRKYKNTMASKVEDIKKQIEEVKKEKDDLVADYGEKIEQTEQTEQNVTEETKETEETSTKADEKKKQNNENKKENNENKKENVNENKSKKADSARNIVSSGMAVESNETTSTGENKKQESPEEKLKTEFKELFNKAKRGALTDKDFDRLSNIMQNPENYDKLGITTGVIFNKAKVIFKAMAKSAQIDGLTVKNAEEKLDEKLNKANDIVKQNRDTLSEEGQTEWDNAEKHIKQYGELKATMKVYGDVSKKRMQEKWSWLFEFESDAKPALPAEIKPSEEVKKDDLSSKLAGQTIDEPDYKDVATDTREKESQEQIK